VKQKKQETCELYQGMNKRRSVVGEKCTARFYNFYLEFNLIQNVWLLDNAFGGMEKVGLNMENPYKIYFSRRYFGITISDLCISI
jgi:hypothetical protein